MHVQSLFWWGIGTVEFQMLRLLWVMAMHLSTAQTPLGISYPVMTSWIQNRRRNWHSRVYPQIPSWQFAQRTWQNKLDFHGMSLVGYFTPFGLGSLVWKHLPKLMFAQCLPSLKKGRWQLRSPCLSVRVTCFRVLQVQHFQEHTLLLYSPLYYINCVLIRTVFQLSEILSKT